MAKKKKLSTNRKQVIHPVNKYQKPRWMKVLKLITLIIFSIFALLVLAGAIIKYYQLISGNK